MKIITILLIAGATVFSSLHHAAAQSSTNTPVKVLRTPDAGIIKVLYSGKSDKSTQVTFLTRTGEAGTDRIKGNYPKGFLKRYDVKRLAGQDFWVQVSNGDMTIVYRIVPSADGSRFTPYLEKAVYDYEVVAKR